MNIQPFTLLRLLILKLLYLRLERKGIETITFFSNGACLPSEWLAWKNAFAWNSSFTKKSFSKRDRQIKYRLWVVLPRRIQRLLLFMTGLTLRLLQKLIQRLAGMPFFQLLLPMGHWKLDIRNEEPALFLKSSKAYLLDWPKKTCLKGWTSQFLKESICFDCGALNYSNWLDWIACTWWNSLEYC